MTDREIPPWGHLLNSGIAGILGWICIHPLNTITISMSSSKSDLTSAQMAKDIVAKEGFAGLYAGLTAGLARQVVYSSSRLGFFDIFKGIATNAGFDMNLGLRLSLATLAGGCAAMISCPVEVSLVRLSMDKRLPSAERRGYTGVVNALTTIARTEGITAYWNGCQPFVVRCCLVGATQVGSYDQLKASYSTHFGLSGTPLTLASSLSAGLIYSTVTMPFETAKNRMASERSVKGQARQYTSTLGTMRAVTAAQGSSALFRGFLPYFGRCGGHSVAMFFFLEKVKAMWPLKAGAEGAQ